MAGPLGPGQPGGSGSWQVALPEVSPPWPRLREQSARTHIETADAGPVFGKSEIPGQSFQVAQEDPHEPLQISEPFGVRSPRTSRSDDPLHPV